MVVESHFPEPFAGGFTKCEGSTLLEKANQFEEIGVVGGASNEHMKMIGHDAIGVKEKRFLCSAL